MIKLEEIFADKKGYFKHEFLDRIREQSLDIEALDRRPGHRLSNVNVNKNSIVEREYVISLVHVVCEYMNKILGLKINTINTQTFEDIKELGTEYVEASNIVKIMGYDIRA
jgi:serine phosphatase RsbU (regulator of sigma subunit)